MERVPIILSESGNRLIRYSKNYSNSQLNGIRAQMLSHLGDYALWYREEKREVLPILVELVQFYPFFTVARYKTYDPSGDFRQYLYVSISHSSLYCGYEKLFFFENDI